MIEQGKEVRTVVRGCSACGQDHDITFHLSPKITRIRGVAYNYFGKCYVTGKIVFMYITPETRDHTSNTTWIEAQ